MQWFMPRESSFFPIGISKVGFSSCSQEVSLFENQCIKNETEPTYANRLSRVKPLPERRQPSSAWQRQLTLSRSSCVDCEKGKLPGPQGVSLFDVCIIRMRRN